MEKLLIVEDEKLIRQGLRAIILRSRIPVGEVLECRNGVEALQILKNVPVDAVFTDVRMPKMDGITLIRTIQEELPEPRPEVVVISGHDDFNYAVDAMRYGSREYILKPVERERVYQVLEKLEQYIVQKRQDRSRRSELEKLSRQQLRYMLLNPEITGEEAELIENAFNDLVAYGSYVVLCLNRRVELSAEETAFQLDNVGRHGHILVLPQGRSQDFLSENLSDCYVGVSSPHRDAGEFREAFSQAVAARKYAFYTGRRCAAAQDAAYLEETVPQQRTPLQLARQLGTKEYVGLVLFFNGLFGRAARGRLYPHLFEEFYLEFVHAVQELYGRFVDGQGEAMEMLTSIYRFDTVDALRLAFLEWLERVHMQVHGELESSRNQERIKTAVQYLEEHYDKSLNMAVVSNHISMNYSVFSQMFKEYTGKNFVDYLRDYRMEKAKELLVNTDRRISEISELVGYENDKYFMKTFKAAVGVSPTAYRKTEQMRIYGALL